MTPDAGPPVRGRHRAAARSAPAPRRTARVVAVGAAVLLVVGLGGALASRLGADDGDGTAAPVTSPGTTTSGPAGTEGPAGASDEASAPAASVPPAVAPPTAAEDPAPPGDPIPGPGSPVRSADGVVPTGLQVPAIDLDVPLLELGLREDGTVDVPEDPDDAGWLRASAVPGRTGPAVLAGHVDSATGVAVFTRLEELVAGDEVAVGLSDGSTVRYTVTSSERYPKDAFPSASVYGPAPASVLRLITCGGTFDRAAGSYEDNLVVYAVPTA